MIMTVREAKQFCLTATSPELLAEYRRLKAKQARMSLAQLIAALRATDRLHAEMKRRGLLTSNGK
jgi:hypothetical protein